MKTTNDVKNNFLSLYYQLPEHYKHIVLSTFKHLVDYEDTKEKGYTPFDISGTIKHHQQIKGYSDQEVCDIVNDFAETIESGNLLDIGTFRKIKSRNTQTSKPKTKWLTHIAKALEFDQDEYHKYLTPEGLNRVHQLITQHSDEVNSIDKLYDLLSPKEAEAMRYLILSLSTLNPMIEYYQELSENGYENI